MVDSITNTLGAGSGIDIQSLVSQLVSANFQAKNGQLNRQEATIGAQISAASSLKSNIIDFAQGLRSLAKGGTVQSQASSANPDIVRATAIPGAKLSALSAQLEVRQLAQAQSVASSAVVDRVTPVGTGTLRLQLGRATTAGGAITGFTPGAAAPVDIAITPANASLDGIAAAINAANAGVTATIITDASGARLALKGKSGEAQGFTLTATEDVGAPGLAALNIGIGSTVGTAAQDAIVALDGITVTRPTNSISDLIDGVKLDLVAARPGTAASITSSTPTDAIKQSVGDLVSAYNNLVNFLKQQVSAADGPLRQDGAARGFGQSLSRLTLTNLVTTNVVGAPKTLADIGVATNRDGTLSVRADRLDAALRDFPAAVEAIFADGTGATGNGLAAAFQDIADRATDANAPAGPNKIGLGGSLERYTARQSAIAVQRDRVAADTDNYRARLTKQFAGADARISAYKSTQSFLTQQIAQWNKPNS